MLRVRLPVVPVNNDREMAKFLPVLLKLQTIYYVRMSLRGWGLLGFVNKLRKMAGTWLIK